jgi:hypothetical protein
MPLNATATRPAPTPRKPATSPLAGGDVAGAGLSVVEGAHWSERLATYRPSGMGDSWLFAAPIAGTAIGWVINHGLWAQVLYLAAAALVLIILADLIAKQVAKVEKRQRRLARTGR